MKIDDLPKDFSTFASLSLKPQGFVLAIVGKPGSGKTYIIQELLKGPLSKTFDYVALCSPSLKEYKDLVPPSQTTQIVSEEWICQMINSINLATNSSSPVKVLFVLDDSVADLKLLERRPKILNLFFNRRHLLWNGCVSLIFTTQKYTMMPARYRSCITDTIMFNLSPFDMDKIYSELIIKFRKGEWKDIISRVFDKEHSFLFIDVDKQIILSKI